MTALGGLTTIYNFCAQNGCADGFRPMSGLVLGTNGNFYGTTSAGGNYGDGTVFKITSEGVLTTLHTFHGADGRAPVAALTEATDESFYGTTTLGGDLTCNAPYGGCGTVFQITPQGGFSTLHMFHGTDGSEPYAGLAQGTDGNLYGTTTMGGANYGTVFRVTGKGAVTPCTPLSSLTEPILTAGCFRLRMGSFTGQLTWAEVFRASYWMGVVRSTA